MKKGFIILSFLFLFLGSFFYVNAQTTTPTSTASSTDSSSDLNNCSGDIYSCYQNVSSFDGSETTTTFDNTTTGGMASVFNYLLTIMAVAIVVLIIFRILQGALYKGTFDNIYDQMKGRKYIKIAGTGLIVFILAYAVLSFINPALTGWTMVTDYLAEIKTRQGSGGQCPTNPYGGSLDIKYILELNEGYKDYVYLDSKGLASIGIGFNLTRPNAKDLLMKAGVPADKAQQLASARTANKDLKLDKATIYKLMEIDLADHRAQAIKDLQATGVIFNDLPINVQTVLTDMVFNMGSLGKFKDMLAAIKAKNWVEASKEIIDSDYCSDVGARCMRNAALMSPGCGGYGANQNSTSIFGNVKKAPQISKSQAVNVKGIWVNKSIESNVRDMLSAMESIGLNYSGSSGWRSLERQRELYAANCGNGTKKCSPPTAVPGSSNHGAGLAIDFQYNGQTLCWKRSTCSPGENKMYDWLKANAEKYHFCKLPSEAWHWSYDCR